MYDLALHVRFLRSATDAFCEFGQASLAAAREMPNSPLYSQAVSSPSTGYAWQGAATQPTFGFDAMMAYWSWWLQAATPQPSVPDFWRHSRPTPSFPFTSPWGWPQFDNPWTSAWLSAFAGPAVGPANFSSMTWILPWARAMAPWSFSPIVSMMMSAGVPYSVAAPSARASASAIDAAEAAQQQWQKFFAAYRTDGGFASAHF